MTATSVTKEKLISLICEGLNAGDRVAEHFGKLAKTPIAKRLTSATKPELLAFINELGPQAVKSLRELESAFPLYRPPTLYLAVMDRPAETDQLEEMCLRLARRGRKAGLTITGGGTVRFIYVPEPITTTSLGKTNLLQLTLHYERRVDIVCSDEADAEYGQLSSVYSLETAFVWLPSTPNHKHAVVACCDYPAIRRLLGFLRSNLSLGLTLPYLDTSTLNKLSEGATPRSATFHTEISAQDSIQNVTLSDPALSGKLRYRQALEDTEQEQTAGFYSQHPGLAGAGLGIARRDGKIWTPKRLDRRLTANLALKLIEQTELELAKVTDPNVLLKHYYGSRAMVGDRELTGQRLRAWHNLATSVLQARLSNSHESNLDIDVLHELIRHQGPLGLLSSLQYDCPNCGTTPLAVCPDCRNPVQVIYNDEVRARCRQCQREIGDVLECDCGTSVVIGDLLAGCRLVPEPELLTSILEATDRSGQRSFNGFFVIKGTTVKVIESRAGDLKRVELAGLQLWQERARLQYRPTIGKAERPRLTRILSRTKEKCSRDGRRPSIKRCAECNGHPLDPKWVGNGETCLLRLFGIAIGEHFDGVHHGRELADIKYTDTIIDAAKRVRIGIHVKSRHNQSPAEGMGRSSGSIKGLYAQLAFSAFQVRERGEKLDVLGVAMPNTIHPDVINSLEFVSNRLGFPFLVIDEDEWLKIIDIAIEHNDFDNSDAEPQKQSHPNK